MSFVYHACLTKSLNCKHSTGNQCSGRSVDVSIGERREELTHEGDMEETVHASSSLHRFSSSDGEEPKKEVLIRRGVVADDTKKTFGNSEDRIQNKRTSFERTKTSMLEQGGVRGAARSLEKRKGVRGKKKIVEFEQVTAGSMQTGFKINKHRGKVRTTDVERKTSHPKKLRVPSTKKIVTLPYDIRHHEVNSIYIQIKEADSPKVGDFECDATTVPDCCAIIIEDSHEAKHICEGFGSQCKGFVMSTIRSKKNDYEYIMYIKNQLNGTMANYLTDFFIKVDYLDDLKWKDEQI
eukprot:gene5723-6423_t